MKNNGSKCPNCGSSSIIDLNKGPKGRSICLNCGHRDPHLVEEDSFMKKTTEITIRIDGTREKEIKRMPITLDGNTSKTRGSFTAVIDGQYYTVFTEVRVTAKKFTL